MSILGLGIFHPGRKISKIKDLFNVKSDEKRSKKWIGLSKQSPRSFCHGFNLFDVVSYEKKVEHRKELRNPSVCTMFLPTFFDDISVKRLQILMFFKKWKTLQSNLYGKRIKFIRKTVKSVLKANKIWIERQSKVYRKIIKDILKDLLKDSQNELKDL